jgi:hypothetical protein
MRVVVGARPNFHFLRWRWSPRSSPSFWLHWVRGTWRRFQWNDTWSCCPRTIRDTSPSSQNHPRTVR